MQVPCAGTIANYGLDKVRFLTPVPAGSRVRASGTLSRAAALAGGVQVGVGITIELENMAKPICVADVVLRYLDLADPSSGQPPGSGTIADGTRPGSDLRQSVAVMTQSTFWPGVSLQMCKE
jgi:hypothetical protein